MTHDSDASTAGKNIGRGAATCRLETREAGAEIAWVTVRHEGKMNAMDAAMIADLTAIFADLQSREALRVVVVSGAGERAFVGGAFVPELYALDPSSGREFITKLHLACQAVRDCVVPVIARLQGYCLGAGTEFAAACDFRIADKSVIFGMPEVKVGLPSVVEAALLPMLVGWGKAREMLLTGANYDAEEGRAMGFLQTVTEIGGLDAVIDLRVAQILAAGPKAVRAQKRLIYAWESLTPSQAIALGVDYMETAYESDEPQRMMAPYLAKKTKS